MKALIVLENHFFMDKQKNIWCDRIIDYNFLKRYLDVFDSIAVMGRCTRVFDNIDDKLLVSGENVDFFELPDFVGAIGLIKNLSKIKKILRNAIEVTDCVIYRAPTHISLFTYKEVLKKNKPLALEFMMSADKMIEGNSIIKNVLNNLIEKIAKKMCKEANGVSYVTEKTLQEKYPCNAILNGETDEYFTESYSTIELEEKYMKSKVWKLNEKPSEYKIIHTGYMDSYRKGQHTLIKALKVVKDKGYNVKLTLVGDGNKKEEFEDLVKKLDLEKNVEFTGLIKNKQEIFSKLQESHLLVFPTEAEGLPRTIIEAMAVGLPCISSPVDGVVELLPEEYLVKYDDFNGYAKKIMELLDDWEKMIKVSNNNFNVAKKYEKNKLDVKRKNFYSKIRKLVDKRSMLYNERNKNKKEIKRSIL